MRIVKSLVPALLLASLLSNLSFAAQDRIAAQLTSGRTIALANHVHRLASPQYDLGPVDPAFRMGTIMLLTVPTSNQRKALQQLLAQQQDRMSPNYHKWLTPDQAADRFGMSQGDAQTITTWLKGQGFTEIKVAHTRNWISFNATAAQVQNAFGTEIHRYNVNGESHYANTTAPVIPAALAGLVAGFRGLHDFKPRPMGIRRARPNYNSSSFGDLVAPGDIATMYDIKALYTAGIDGTGQKLAVAGQTDIFISDITDFRTGFGLSAITGCTSNATTGVLKVCNTPNFLYKLYGTDPGQASSGDLGEADLDLEWSGATARNAQIIYVNAETGGGAFDAYYDAINDNLAPVISLSYGLCESDNQPFVAPDETELMLGNSQGITIVNSSGDSGAAQCDYGNTPAINGPSVNYPASSPEVTSVGGTAIPLGNFTSTYWGTVNGSDGGTALSYIPEQAWNDDDEIGSFCTANPSNSFCTGNGITNAQTAQAAIGISSTGGGPSNCATFNTTSGACTGGFAQPAWQLVTVSGQASARFTPDISLPASPNFPGFVFCTQLSELGIAGTGSSCATGIANSVNNDASIIGGTSASAPIFAGIVALFNQFTGSSQGNINPALYYLAATAPAAFHDVTTSSNVVFCTTGTTGCATGSFGFSAGAGYDLATGLGSIDVDKLAVAVKNPPDFTANTPTTSLSLLAGQSGTATITVTPVHGFNGTVGFACSGLPNGSSCSFNPSTVTPPVTQTIATIQSGGSGNVNGTVVMTASTGTLAQVNHQAASITLDVAPAFTLDPTVPTFQVAQGASVDASMTLTLANGFSGTVNFSCTDPAPESTCTAPPATNASGQVSFHITTTAPTAALQRPFDRGTRIFYAALLPGLLGIALVAGTRKNSSRKLRLLGLMMMLGLSTIWLASCGGSNGGSKDPGTPKNSYTITVKGTSGTATASNTFTLMVQ